MNETVKQRSSKPIAKVLAGWVTGGGAVIVLGILAAVGDSIPVDTFWGGAVTYVVTAAASYIKKAHVSDAGV
jgi:hypothetical protein